MDSSTGRPAEKKAIVAIPARIGSTRLTRKVLLELDGRPMLRHVMNRCGLSEEVSEVWVVTDSQEVARAVESWDGNALMSDPDCPSGTARIASVIDQLQGDPVINVQADQPLVEPELISSMISALAEVDTDIVTPVWRIHSTEDMEDPALAKVVRGHDGQALYFSRSPVPYVREHQRLEWPEVTEVWAHYGVYGFRRRILENYDSIPSGSLEKVEMLEQLRFLEAGYRIHTVETPYRQWAVDSPEDLEILREKMTNSSR